MDLSLCQSLPISVSLSFSVSLSLTMSLPIYLSVCTYLSVIMRNFLQKWKLTCPKMKYFGETSSQKCEVDSIKNEAMLSEFFEKWKVECKADGLVPMRFAFFSIPSV